MTEIVQTTTVLEPIDNELAEQAYQKLSEIFSVNYENAMTEAGEYLLKTFYNNKIELARKKESPKKESLNQLIKRVQIRTPNSPSKSWIYHSIGLVVQSNDIKQLDEKTFQAYGKIPLSHKTSILTVKDIDTKKNLIHEIIDNELSFRDLEKRKIELKIPSSRKIGLLSLISHPDKLIEDENQKLLAINALKELPPMKLDAIKNKAIKKTEALEGGLKELEKRIKEHKTYIKRYNKLTEDIEKTLDKNT